MFVLSSLSRPLEELRSLLAQIDSSNSELTKNFSESEMTIQDHCDELRRKADIRREKLIDFVNKSSNTLIAGIDKYERDCLSSWAEAKETTKHVVEDVNNRMLAFLAEYHHQDLSAQDEYLLSLQAS